MTVTHHEIMFIILEFSVEGEWQEKERERDSFGAHGRWEESLWVDAQEEGITLQRPNDRLDKRMGEEST